MKIKKSKSGNVRTKEIPEYKINAVGDIAKKIKESNTVLIASIKGLPSSQFHEIKKSLRGKAEIKVAKKSIVLRALDGLIKEGVRDLEKYVSSDVALFFSDLDTFELSALLSENQSPAKAKAGDIAPEDIIIEPGPTSLVPGPAISELSSVGLKVAVEGGKLAIKQGATVAHKGEIIKENVASVIAKLDILPMRVGFEPIVAYDAKEKKVYTGIKVDKKKTLEELKMAFSKSLGFSVNIKYLSNDNIKYFIIKAVREEKAIENLFNKTAGGVSQ
ncbi:MAG: 50S ribosomal protein L10 [Nanoarchaeota archaeon]